MAFLVCGVRVRFSIEWLKQNTGVHVPEIATPGRLTEPNYDGPRPVVGALDGGHCDRAALATEVVKSTVPPRQPNVTRPTVVDRAKT
jgi:hypothetical protein